MHCSEDNIKICQLSKVMFTSASPQKWCSLRLYLGKHHFPGLTNPDFNLNVLAKIANATRFSAVTFEPEEIRTRNFEFSCSALLSLCPYMPLSWLVAIHWARSSGYKTLQNNVNVMEWPSKSPDLSQIEQVWDLLDRGVCQCPVQPQMLRQLQEALVQVWNNIPMNVIRRYLCSVRRLCRAVIHSAGVGGEVGGRGGAHKVLICVNFWKLPQWRVCADSGVIWMN